VKNIWKSEEQRAESEEKEKKEEVIQ